MFKCISFADKTKKKRYNLQQTPQTIDHVPFVGPELFCKV